MTQNNTLNVKQSNSQLNNIKSGIKNYTKVILNFSSNVIGDSNEKSNFPHKLLLTGTQVSKFRKTFGNGSSANIKFSITQLSKMIQSGGVFRDIPIFGNILSSVAKKEIDIARSFRNNFLENQIDKSNEKYKIGSGIPLRDNETKDILIVIKSLENRGILFKQTTEKINS